jgi:hypothetical protein
MPLLRVNDYLRDIGEVVHAPQSWWAGWSSTTSQAWLWLQR